jgi:membrane protein DedA with SNARE-associated domain
VHIQQLLKDALETHGYWVLFVGTLLEGETILIVAGFLAFQGYFHIAGVMTIAFAGSFLGDQAYFYLGRRHGRMLLKRFHFIARRLREALRLIEKYGSFVAFISRFTYGFRIILPIILGITRLAPRTFLLINLASALAWSVLFSSAGYLFGKSASLFLDNISQYEHYLLLALVGIMVLIWLFHFYHAWNLKKPARIRLVRLKAFRTARNATNG